MTESKVDNGHWSRQLSELRTPESQTLIERLAKVLILSRLWACCELTNRRGKGLLETEV